MSPIKYPRGVSLLFGCLMVSQIAIASDGYFPHGTGAKNKALAGAGMAMPEDAISIVNNPAVAAFLDDRMDVGLAIYQPRRNLRVFGEGSKGANDAFSLDEADTDSDNDLFFTPEFAQTRQLKNNSAFAWAFYMRNGIGTSIKGGGASFDPDGDGPLGVVNLPGTYGDGDTALELSQALVDVTWAKKLGEQTAIGISAVLAAQSLKVKGTGGLARYTETFAASNGLQAPDKLGGNGRDINYGAGLKIGLHRRLGDHFSFGIMYQSKINIGSSSDYSDLLTAGGDLDIPSWVRMGMTWQPVDRFSFSIDAQRIFYSEIDALGNSFSNVYACPGAGLGGTDLSSCLGGKNGPGFGWKDVPIYNFGASWDVNDRWTVRAGMSISDQPTPINENTFNIMLIDLTEAHYTAGFTRKLSNGHELSFAFMYAEEESIEHPNQLDSEQRILLTNDEFDFQVSYSWGH